MKSSLQKMVAHQYLGPEQEYMSSVQNPFLFPLNPGWFIGIPLLDYEIIPNMLGSIIHELIINHHHLSLIITSMILVYIYIHIYIYIHAQKKTRTDQPTEVSRSNYSHYSHDSWRRA